MFPGSINVRNRYWQVQLLGRRAEFSRRLRVYINNANCISLPCRGLGLRGWDKLRDHARTTSHLAAWPRGAGTSAAGPEGPDLSGRLQDVHKERPEESGAAE